MSSRYDDTYRERDYDRPGRYEREADRREAGRGLRQDVRETGREIRDAGGDIVSSVCGLWGNLLNSLGDAVSPRSSRGRYPARASSRYEDDEYQERSGGLFNCLGGELSIKCGNSESRADRSSEGYAERDDDRDNRTSARVSGRNTEIDVNT